MKNQFSIHFSNTAFELNAFQSELFNLRNNTKPLLQKSESPNKLIQRMKKKFEKHQDI